MVNYGIYTAEKMNNDIPHKTQQGIIFQRSNKEKSEKTESTKKNSTVGVCTESGQHTNKNSDVRLQVQRQCEQKTFPEEEKAEVEV